jgi:beta-N-acetylhexosaminidase
MRFSSLVVIVMSLLSLSCGGSRTVLEMPDPIPPPPEEFPEMSFTITGELPSWIDSVRSSMSLEQKVGQMVMPHAYGHYFGTDSDEYERLERLVRELHVGGLVMFQGEVLSQAVLLNRLQAVAKVPLLISSDFERGAAMRLRRATYFPDAMAIGATRNMEYAYRVGRAIAREARAIGVHQNFAPVADINNNQDNPVINTRAFGEDPKLVADMVDAFVRGTNEGGVISTAKHFPGHGDTGVDSHLELPVLPFGRDRLDSVELSTFRRAIESGVMSVMMAHLAIPAMESGKTIPASLSSAAITDVLKGELGFRGLVVTDAMDMLGVVRGFSTAEAAVRAVSAGIDVLLMPTNPEVAINAITTAVRRGQIPEDRINEAVTKILMAKQWLLLDENRFVDVYRLGEVVASREHRQLARDVARDAITVVRNEGKLLPLNKLGRKRVVSVVISDTDDNRTEIHRPGSPWPNEPVGAYFTHQFRRRHRSMETYRLGPSSSLADIDSVINRMRRADVVIIPLYVKVRTSTGKIGIPERLQPFVQKAAVLTNPTVVISYGNPYLVGSFPKAQALVCAYADAEVMVEASVEALFGEIQVKGRLPVTIPGLFPYGSGVTLAHDALREDSPAAAGFERARLRAVDRVIKDAIRDSVFPGAQVAIVKDGVLALNRAYGTHTYELASRDVSPETIYDLASLTKVIATTTAVMKLHDEGKLSLDDQVAKYVPQFSTSPKSRITLRHLLTHTSGLPPFRQLWKLASSAEAALDSVYATQLVAVPGDTTIYSDLGMITMGKIVEKITGMSLDAYMKQEFFEPLGMTSTTFTPLQEWWVGIAPTEVDTGWRRQLVWGTVHDENADLLGGVSGHAGLFSTATDLAVFMQMLLNGGTYRGEKYLNGETIMQFTRRQSESSTRALGWDTKSATGSSAGNLFSARSFGHTGFTGTSIWVDPDRNLAVVFLTNRVHPTRANTKIFRVRPALHDAVIDALEGAAGAAPGSSARR